MNLAALCVAVFGIIVIILAIMATKSDQKRIKRPGNRYCPFIEFICDEKRRETCNPCVIKILERISENLHSK